MLLSTAQLSNTKELNTSSTQLFPASSSHILINLGIIKDCSGPCLSWHQDSQRQDHSYLRLEAPQSYHISDLDRAWTYLKKADGRSTAGDHKAAQDASEPSR